MSTEPPPQLPSSPLFVVLQELRKLALDAALCQQILQALADGTAPVLTLLESNSSATAASASALSVAALLASPADAAGTATASAANSNSGGKKKKKRARVSTAAAAAAAAPSLETANVNPVAQGGFWILLATHVLNRLLASLDNQHGDDDNDDGPNHKDNISQVMALLSYFLARVLLPVKVCSDNNSSSSHDRAMQKLLEKACSHRAKSLLGRAILSITVGATTALDHLAAKCTDDDDNDTTLSSSLSLACWIPATLALDMAVRLSRACPKAFASSAGTGTSTTTVTGTTAPGTPATTTTTATASPVTSGGSPTTAAAASPLSPSTPSAHASSASSTTTNAVIFWNQSQAQLEDVAMNIMSDNTDSDNDDDSNGTTYKPQLETMCQELSQDVVDMTRWEVPCLAALLGITPNNNNSNDTAAAAADETEEPSPPAKRAVVGRRKSSRSAGSSTAAAQETHHQTASSAPQGTPNSPHSHPLLRAFQALVSDGGDADDHDDHEKLNTLKMDGRVAAKRWSSMALVWLMQGQRRVLEAMVGMLTRRLEWQRDVWKARTRQDDNNSSNTKKRSSSSTDDMEVDATGQGVVIPGNVALMALVTRLAGIVTETHAQSGSRVPSGGLDAYVRSILPAYQTAAAGATKKAAATTPGKKSAKKAPKAVIPDLRDLATVVLYHMLQAHEDCLEANHQQLGSEGETTVRLVNDEDHGSDDNTDADRNLQTFNPVMRPLVEGLCRAASATASSAAIPSSNFAEQTLGCERLRKIASIFVMQNIREDAMSTTAINIGEALGDLVPRHERPLDVQLVHFAVSQLNACLEKAELNRHGLSGNAGGEAMSDSGEYDANTVASRYGFLEPVPVPEILKPPSAASTATAVTRRGSSRGARSTAPNPPSCSCSYASMLAPDTSKRAQEPEQDDLLALFVRSMVTLDKAEDSKKGPRSKTKKKQSRRGKGPSDDVDLPSPAAKLYSTLLAIVQRAYDGPSVVPPSEKAADRTTKRAAPTAKGLGRKRRKTNDGLAAAGQTDESATTMEENRQR